MKDHKETLKDYDSGVEWHIQKSYSYNWKKQIKIFIGGLKGNKVLDTGCGGGRDITEFIENNISIEGLDYSSATIKKCKEKFPDIKFYVEDIRDIRLPDNEYNGVWACATLLNIEKKEVPLALLEFKRILKKEGKLFISVKEGMGERIIADQAGKRFFSFYSLNEIKEIVRDSGFKIEHTELIPDSHLTGKSITPANPSWICIYATNSSKNKS